MIRVLLGSKDLGWQQSIDNPKSYFEWLKQSDFVEFSKGHYRLDDVARDVFRQSYFQDDQNQFRKTHALLANYFKQQADELFPPQSLLPDPYEDAEWRGLIAEFLYYSLFGKGREGLHHYIEQVLIAAYLREPDVFIAPFAFIKSELSDESQTLLPGATNKFFKDAAMALRFGWLFLGLPPKSYKLEFEDEDELSEEAAEELLKKVEASLQVLLKQVGNLSDGSGKCIGLMYKSLRCDRSRQVIDSLLQAKSQAEQFYTHCRSKLLHSLFSGLGSSLLAIKSYQESLDCCEQALELWKNPHTFLNKGIVLDSLERYEEALESFQNAIDLNPKFVEAWASRGSVLRRWNRYEEALISCNRTLAIDSDNPKALNCYALTLSLLQEFEKAIAAIDKAIHLEPENALLKANRGILLARAGRYIEALAACEQASKQDPHDESVYYARACYYALQDDIELVIDHFQKAIAIAPRSSRREAKCNPDFERIREDERFRALLYPGSNC